MSRRQSSLCACPSQLCTALVQRFSVRTKIADGSLLILDEFDTHLHAMILPEILELFTNSKINRKNSQLVITAHNTEILDSLGRYKTILVNKEKNESYCYRLDNVSLLRQGRSISPVYSKGKIGGAPLSVKGLASRIADSWDSFQ
jgi:ABC-type ATPase involved in cell division